MAWVFLWSWSGTRTHLNAARMSAACRRSDGGNSLISASPAPQPEKVPDLIRYSSLVFLFYAGMIPETTN